MRIPATMPLAITVLLAWTLSAPADEAKSKPVMVQDLKLQVPETWKQTEPSSKLRLAQFEIPAAEGEEVATELVVYSFPGGGGGVDPNLKRWIDQFAGEGRTAKLASGKSEQGEYYVADIQGTYNMPVGPPVLRKTEAVPNARMLGAIVIVEGKGVYFLKLTGPAKSVEPAAKAFRASFGADASKEEEYELKAAG